MKTPTKEKARKVKRLLSRTWPSWNQHQRLLAINLFGLAAGHTPTGQPRAPTNGEIGLFIVAMLKAFEEGDE